MGTSFSDIVNSNQLVLVDFFAEWCGPCKMMAPILKTVKENVGEKANIVKIDVDKNPAVAQQFEVRGVPTLVLFKNGKPVWRQSGVVRENELVQLISSNS